MILSTPFVPRSDDGVLRVIIPGRISKPTQDIESITSQHEDAAIWLDQMHRGPVETMNLGEQASGWLADRDTMVQAKALIETGRWDAVVATELREIYRNPAFHWAFAHACVDAGVRFICIADNIDTAADDWEIMMYVASMRHGMTVPEVRRRVKRKASSTFSSGGMVMKIKFGYRKLNKEEAASGQFGTVGLRIAKLPGCTPIIGEMKGRVMRGASYTAIADWLNEEGIAPGQYVVGGRWTDRLVERLLRDPILSGQRRFRTSINKMVFKTGKHRAEPNPDGPATNQYPELAHFTPEEHAELLATMDLRRNAANDRFKGKEHPRWRVLRSRSIWPGQHARCGICGGVMYRCDYYLKCQNAVPNGPRTCWNHLQVDYGQAQRKVVGWLVEILDQHHGVRNLIVAHAFEELSRGSRRRQQTGSRIDARISELTKESNVLAIAIRKGGQMESLLAQLKKVEADLEEARDEKQAMLAQADREGRFHSREQVDKELVPALLGLVERSFDFADLLRQLIPEFIIQPVQALDTGLVRPQAKLTLSTEAWEEPGVTPTIISATQNLFDLPEQIKHIAECVAAKQAHPEESVRALGERLRLNYNTVSRALIYAKLMENEGITAPYRQLRLPPKDVPRWKKRSGAPRAQSA